MQSTVTIQHFDEWKKSFSLEGKKKVFIHTHEESAIRYNHVVICPDSITISLTSQTNETFDKLFPKKVTEKISRCDVSISFIMNSVHLIPQIPFAFKAVFYNQIEDEKLRQKCETLYDHFFISSFTNYFFDEDEERRKFLVEELSHNYHIFLKALSKSKISSYLVIVRSFPVEILKALHQVEENCYVKRTFQASEEFESNDSLIKLDNLIVNSISCSTGPLFQFLTRDLYDPRLLCLINEFRDETKQSWESRLARSMLEIDTSEI